MMFSKSLMALAAALLLSCLGSSKGDEAAVTTGSAALLQVSSFGTNPGNLTMFEYVPARLANGGAAVVVAMHGCTQSAAEYQKAGWNTFADSNGVIIVYPQTTANGSCFAWWDAGQARRGAGQALSILQMVDSVRARYTTGQIFVTGLSAGGAMTAVMLAAYPEVFTAGAVFSGLPFKCANSQSEAFSCMFSAKTQTAAQWGQFVRDAAPVPAAYPRVAVWHGTADGVVVPANADELLLQWTNVHGVSATPRSTQRVGDATVTRYAGADGLARVESWRIAKMGHGTPVDPKSGCGTAGAYLLDVGICSTTAAAKFFGLISDSGSGGGLGCGAGGGSDSGGDAGVCADFYASNYAHTTSGRATLCGSGSTCTIGSGEQLGLWNLYTTSWVREVRPGYFEAGRCR